MITSRHICAVIPTYNNGGTIADVVRRVAEQMHDIIVVIDGSTDDTREVLRSLEIALTIVDCPKNGGKGVALKKGFMKARELGFTHALTIDADGQHLPEDIPLLYRAHTVHPEAIIIGSRVLEQENMPSQNTFANRFSNFWFALQTGLRLPDTQSGFRIYPLGKRLHGERLLTARYEAELTLLVFSAWANVQIVAVPIRVYYPPKEERVSHFRPAYDFTRISILNTVLCVLAVVYGLPRRWWRSLWYYPFFSLYLLLFVTPVMRWLQLRYGNTEEMNMRLHRFVRKYVRPLITMIPGAPLVEKGAEYSEKPAIYIANHNSQLDILYCLSISDKVTLVAKEWVLRNALFGRLARGFHIIPGSQNKEMMEEAIRRVAELGYSVVIFPEGTRSLNGDLQTFHRGAFYFAESLGLPIRPLVFRGFSDVWNKANPHIGPGKIEVVRLPEIGQDDARRQDGYAAMSKRMAAEYKIQLDQIANPRD